MQATLVKFAGLAFIGMLTVVLSPLLALLYLGGFFKAGVLGLWWHVRHGRHGRHWLAVYSDGTKWKAHFANVVVPMLGASAHVVNVSARPSWPRARSLERQVHRFWAGRTEHTPVLIRPPGLLRRARTVRMYEPYMRYAVHHDPSSLEQVVAQVQAFTNEA